MSDSQVWSLKEMLADITREFPSTHMLPRHWAAEVLTTVGENIAWGNSNSGFSPREVGWALVRVFGAFDEKDLKELAQGCMEAKAFISQGTVPTDLQG